MTGVLFVLLIALVAVCLAEALSHHSLASADKPSRHDRKIPLSFIAYLQDLRNHPALIAYTPLGFDPTASAPTTRPTADSVEMDLQALRSGFDGLVLYSYDAGVTPTIVIKAIQAEYRAILLGIWNPRSEDELEGTASLVKAYGKEIAFAVCIGNEGITFNRYTITDVMQAQEQLLKLLGSEYRVPYCTTEPLGQYAQPSPRQFGDFLAPTIHPVFDRPRLGPEGAAYWAREQALRLAQFSAKPVLVKETGFPHAGTVRYTPESQRRFWRAYNLDSHFVRLSVNPPVWVSYAAAFEAFDQPCEAQQSLLLIEQFWGLLDRTRTPSPAFSLWSTPLDGS